MLNKGAHPSGLIQVQLKSGMPGFSQLTANFDRDLLNHTLSIGTVALAKLLHETSASLPADKNWWAEFVAVMEDRTRRHEEMSSDE